MPPRRKPPDYAGIEAKMWRKHRRSVVPNLNKKEKYIVKKISTFIDRFGFSRRNIEQKIRDDEMFAAWFAKEPRRTSIHEKTARDWLEEALRVNIEKLPASGKNALYVDKDGEVVKKSRSSRKLSKSLDFRWKAHGKTFYAMHKFTKEGGGTQDSQYKEMQTLLTNFLPAQNRDICLIVIVDGDFYDERKMEDLKSLERRQKPYSHAVPIEKVPTIVRKSRG